MQVTQRRGEFVTEVELDARAGWTGEEREDRWEDLAENRGVYIGLGCSAWDCLRMGGKQEAETLGPAVKIGRAHV